MTGLSTDKGCFEIVQVIQDKLLGYFLFSSLSDNSLRSWLATFPHRVYLMSTDSFFVQRGHAHGHCYRLAYYDHTKSKGLSRIEAICWENIMGQWVHYNKQIFSYISKGSCPLHAAEPTAAQLFSEVTKAIWPLGESPGLVVKGWDS